MRHRDLPSISFYLGKRFGNYKITAVIARGASGCVYRAHHVVLGRVAAVKFLRPDRPHSLATYDRLLDEGRLLDRLRHPHILPVYECGTDHDIPYLVMKYARGGSLRERLDQRFYRPLPLEDALIVLSQIGDALAYAHQLGVIHRDIKPENILFNTRGDAFLADVGIAVVRAPDESERMVDGSGTPAYMPPEQFNGVVDARSDLYALGCTAYEMLTGHRPFNAPDHVALAVKHAREHPVPPTLLNPKLPSRIDAVILKALEKRRVNRYPDVRAFIADLLACATTPLPEPSADHLLFSSQQERKVEHFLDKATRLYLAAYYAEALGAYNEALRLDASCARAYLGRGNALYKLQEYDEALVAYQLALRFDPYNAEYHSNKGAALRALGRSAEALAAYKQALQLDPTCLKALRGLRLARQQRVHVN